ECDRQRGCAPRVARSCTWAPLRAGPTGARRRSARRKGGRLRARHGRLTIDFTQADNYWLSESEQERFAMNAINEMPTEAIVLTEAAVGKVKSLIEEEGNPDLKLRIFVTGGGCSGFQYGFTFDEALAEDDTAMVKDGVTFLVDSMSFQYLMGAEID